MRKLSAVLILSFLSGVLLAEDQQSPDLTAAIKQHLKLSTNEQAPENQYAAIDLNNDGIKDVVVWLNDKGYCGSGGCNMQIYLGTKSGYTFISNSTIVQLPIRVLESKSNGWKQLIVFTKGGGNVILSFNGKKYPSNPSLQPKATNEQMQTSSILINRQTP